MSTQRVAILGASHKTDTYANKAMKKLREAGHEVILINPGLTKIEDQEVLPTLSAITGGVDTLTMYVRPVISSKVAEELLTLKPGRVIFNPGTENSELTAKLDEAGIPWQNACTLVLLRTGQF